MRASVRLACRDLGPICMHLRSEGVPRHFSHLQSDILERAQLHRPFALFTCSRLKALTHPFRPRTTLTPRLSPTRRHCLLELFWLHSSSTSRGQSACPCPAHCAILVGFPLSLSLADTLKPSQRHRHQPHLKHQSSSKAATHTHLHTAFSTPYSARYTSTILAATPLDDVLVNGRRSIPSPKPARVVHHSEQPRIQTQPQACCRRLRRRTSTSQR